MLCKAVRAMADQTLYDDRLQQEFWKASLFPANLLWDKVVLCASKASLTSWWVDGEINRAFQKKAEITSSAAANFVGWEKDHVLFDRELEKVIRALRTDDGGREPPLPTRL